MKKHRLSAYTWASIIISAVVFGYICLRAALISICHDEALTYLVHARSTFLEIFFHPTHLPGNNHLLNTVLIKIFTNLFGNSELIIRIPALIGCALFITASYNILNLFLKNLKFVVGLTLLITNVFLVDFFSCARGYSLGLGFFMAALYYYFRRVKSDVKSIFKYNVLIIASLTLAVLSNLTFVNIYLPVVCALILLELYEALFNGRQAFVDFKNNFITRTALPLLLSVSCIAVIYDPPMLRSIKNEPTVAVGKIGFWRDTVDSMIWSNLQDKKYATPETAHALKILIVILLMTAVMVLIYSALKKKIYPEIKYLFSISFMLFFMAIVIKLEDFLFKTGYVTGRLAIYIIPLFLLFVLLLWKNFEFIFSKMLIRVTSGALYCLALLMIMNNIFSANLSNFYTWRIDAATKQVMAMINHKTEGRQRESGGKYKIGINWFFEPSTNYYIFVNNMQQVDSTTREGPDGVYDFYYLIGADEPVIKKYNLKIIKFFDLPKSYFAER